MRDYDKGEKGVRAKMVNCPNNPTLSSIVIFPEERAMNKPLGPIHGLVFHCECAWKLLPF